MAARIPALVKPALLIWARETAGYTVETAADKAHLKAGNLKEWEAGADFPSVPQLRKLAGIYHRPLAAFYLPSPPASPPSPRDFRRLADTPGRQPSPDLLLEIRQARWRRELALELYVQVESDPLPTFNFQARLEDDPEEVSNQIRELLGIRYEDQIKWHNSNDAFRRWRASFENLGVLVFQTTGIPLIEMRGFAVSDFPLPAIVVNNRDHYHARIFTMLHEFVHILLREHSLCDIDDDYSRDRTKLAQTVEVFCNHVAGATLVPARYLLLEEAVSKTLIPRDWSDNELKVMAQKYRVSGEVVLRRLLIMGKTTPDFYQSRRVRLQTDYETHELKKKKKDKPGFAPPATVALANSGVLFTRLVLSGYHGDQITARDVSEYLGIRLGQFSKIEARLQHQLLTAGGT